MEQNTEKQFNRVLDGLVDRAVENHERELKRRAEDAERPAAEQLQWSGFDEHITAKGKPVSVIENFEDTFHSVFAAPAVEAANLPPLPEFFALGKTRINGEEHGHFGAKQMQDYARAAIAAARALPLDAAELGKLKALAEAATPGPWSYAYTRIGHTVRQSPDAMCALLVVNASESPEADAEFIAAANPAVILRIAALVAQQAARIAELEVLAIRIAPALAHAAESNRTYQRAYDVLDAAIKKFPATQEGK